MERQAFTFRHPERTHSDSNREEEISGSGFKSEDEHVEPDARYLMELKETLGKGIGWFAREDIPRGTCVLAETPLVDCAKSCTGPCDECYLTPRQILAAFERLTPAKKDTYLQLHAHTYDGIRKWAADDLQKSWDDISQTDRDVIAIYCTNSFGKIYFYASRFNHDCVANTSWTFNPALGKMTFHTVRDIQKGEELTIWYTDAYTPRKQRQAVLGKFGIRCTCAVCEDTPEGERLEQKRVRLNALKKRMLEAPDTAAGDRTVLENALRDVEELIAIMEAEGWVMGIELAYRKASNWNYGLGNTRLALSWLEKELDARLTHDGADHPKYIQRKLRYEEIKATL